VLLRRVVLGAVSVDSTDGLHMRAVTMSGKAQGNACETTTSLVRGCEREVCCMRTMCGHWQ
jgi:hypothetical protein